MKVIDILNDLVNDRVVYPYIKYYNRSSKSYEIMLNCEENIINKLDQGNITLYDEIDGMAEHKEEPQEHKIPEKFELHSWGDKNEYGAYVDSPFPTEEEFMNKINEILDYLEVNNDRKGS